MQASELSGKLSYSGGESSRKPPTSHNLFIQSIHIQRQPIQHRVRPAVRRHPLSQLTAAEAAVVLQEFLLCALHYAWAVAVVGYVAASAD